MKFEKLDENKIRITVSIHDLEEKDIDFHDFMSNSLESQNLFFDMLEEAEEKIGFKTKNCKIKVEAFAMTEDNFILTITRIMPDSLKKHLYVSPRKKVKAKRKSDNLHVAHLIYKFNSFDDYCNFVEFLVKNNLQDASKIAKEISLYIYNAFYYLVLHNINTDYRNITTFFTAITEFGSYVINPDLFSHKLYEAGTIFMKNNAFRKSFLHYTKK